MVLNNGFQIGIFVVVCIAAFLSAATLIFVTVRDEGRKCIEEPVEETLGMPCVRDHRTMQTVFQLYPALHTSARAKRNMIGKLFAPFGDPERMTGLLKQFKGLEVLKIDFAADSTSLPLETSKVPTTLPVQCQQVDDVAIIGAGIAGSYAAWRLRRANLSVTVYEYSDRIGGRCNTVRFPDVPDINIELGAMRFIPEEHILLNRTISELGLEVIDFLPGTLGNTMYYLRGEHLSEQQLADQAPYKLKPEHRKAPEQLKWEIFNNLTDTNTSIDGFSDVPRILDYLTPDGIPLYKQSMESFNGKYLYPELAAYLEDAHVFINKDVTAASYLPTGDPERQTESNYKTVVDGFQSIPETLVKEFLDSSNV